MIEVSVREIEGVRFLGDIKILEPDDMKYGVGVHRIPTKLLHYDTGEFAKALKLLGLRNVGYDPAYRAFLYTQYPISYWRYKATHLALKTYWWILFWLYKNARVFQAISPHEQFSWKYFTPYVWFKRLRR